jgi:protein arginine N-methyltransferase 1
MTDRRVGYVSVRGATVPVMLRPARSRNGIAIFPSVGEYPIYEDSMYSRLSHSPTRNAAYLAAIARSAPGRVVVDIGSGRDGLWAVACARAGAAHVYAIEVLPDVAEQARAAVAQAGLADRVTVIAGHSTAVDLPRRAQVCVSEIVGNIAGAEGAAAVIGDARRRLCQPSAISIPDRCATVLAAVTLGASPHSGRVALAAQSAPYLQRIFAAVGHPFDVRLCVAGDPGDLLISTACEVERLHFNEEVSTDTVIRDSIRVTRDALLHGFLLWVRIWCSPADDVLDFLTVPEFSWVPVYAPVSLDGIRVTTGDLVEISFAASRSDDGVHPDYELRGTIVRHRGGSVTTTWRSPHHAPRFRATAVYRDLFPMSTGATVPSRA